MPRHRVQIVFVVAYLDSISGGHVESLETYSLHDAVEQYSRLKAAGITTEKNGLDIHAYVDL